MGLDLASFVEEFRTEAAEHLRALGAQLLVLERDPGDPTPIRAMFLAAHSLKGAGAMLDLADVEALAHAMEEVLSRLRDGTQRLDGQTADTLFRAIDLLGERVARAMPGAAPADPPIAAMVAALIACDGSGQAASAAPPPPAPEADDQHAPRALLVEDSATVRLLHTALLTEAGFVVDAVADGQEGLALTKAHRYRVIVAGQEARGLRGPELVAAVRAGVGSDQPPCIITRSSDSPPADNGLPSIGYVVVASPRAEALSALVRDLATR
ncbi:MAG TPA: Hpt domain-containing protein [Thermomicrobiales bacterium]|jgi:chemotaxis protein histidine kinase CheA